MSRALAALHRMLIRELAKEPRPTEAGKRRQAEEARALQKRIAYLAPRPCVPRHVRRGAFAWT
jgi:hypothetical protein